MARMISAFFIGTHLLFSEKQLVAEKLSLGRQNPVYAVR
jgi:hypothetical protein